MKTLLLDCSLRDGGYYTNWDFNYNLVVRYAKAMESLPIDYVEVGYRSIPLTDYFGKFFYCPDYVLKDLKELMPTKKIAIILNEKDIRVEDLNELLLPVLEYVSLVRIAVDPINIERAINLAKSIKALGFEVAFNVMYLSNWKNDLSFLNPLSKAEDFLDYFYMVDSFGGIMPTEIIDIVRIVKNKVNVPIGFHGHNNLEMALANTITALGEGCQIIDSTITGMGRGAGNLKTELILTYLNKHEGLNFDFGSLSTTVADFEDLNNEYHWGTSLPYMFSGAYSLPQKQVMEWVSLNRYSMETIINALNMKKGNNIDNLSLPLFEAKKEYDKAIIVGGGQTVVEHKEAISKFLEENNNIAVIFAGVRHLEVLDTHESNKFIALSGREISKLSSKNVTFKNVTFVYPPFPRLMGTEINDKIQPFAMELRRVDFTDVSKDSPLCVAVQLALEINVKEFFFIGFDGYDKGMNQSKHLLSQENQRILEDLKTKEGVNVIFLTPSTYQNNKVTSIYSFL